LNFYFTSMSAIFIFEVVILLLASVWLKQVVGVESKALPQSDEYISPEGSEIRNNGLPVGAEG